MRWTVAEFHSILGEPWAERRRLILVEGEILEMPVPNAPHNASLGLTEDALRQAFGAGYWIRPQMPLILGLSTDPMPDIAVVPGSPRDYSTVQPRTAVLVVEISESSLGYDTREKSHLYAAGAIPEYWVIDLVHRQLLVFRDPATEASQPFGGTYRTQATYDAAASVSPLSVASATVRVADLLP